MCTVSFVPQESRIYITSNRDEKLSRKPALHPEFYEMQTGRIAFPKDGHAGGTWIAIHENGNAIVFLNGAEIKHEKKHSYRKSRGLILLEIIDSFDPVNQFETMDLGDIEPFTAVLWSDDNLYQCRWDGQFKQFVEMEKRESHIWASCTLYTHEVIHKRKEWFSSFLEKHPIIEQPSIVGFHLFTGEGDQHNDLRINRNGIDVTVSVTSIVIEEDRISMKYHDLINETETSISTSLIKPGIEK
jgi:hypothetical protein